MLSREVIINILIVLSVWVCLSKAKKPLAKYIHPCSKSAPDFDDCCLAHGKEALPFILKGDKEYNIPNLTPLILPLVSLNNNNFKLELRNLHVNSLDNNELKQVKFNFDKKTLTVKLLFHSLNLQGDADIDGKILIIPLKGSGQLNLTAVEVDLSYDIIYKLEVKDNDEYFSVDKSSTDFTAKRLYFDIRNIFGDNAQLNESTNKAFNDNWQELLEEIKPVVAETITKVGNAIVNGFGGTVPFKQCFLD